MNQDTLHNLVGDTPVSEQIDIALKSHQHPEYVTCDEVNDLKKKIEMLMNLVGDTPVSEQIYTAINNIK